MPEDEKTPIAPEDLFHLRTAGDLALHPDGSRLVWVEKWQDPEENAYRTSLWEVRFSADGTASEPRRLTSGTSDASPRWSPDGRWLAFLRRVEKDNQIFVLPADGGEARAVTRIAGGCAGPVWSPDSRWLAFTARVDERGMREAGDGDEESGTAAPDADGPRAGADGSAGAERWARWEKKYTADVKVITRPMYKMDGFGFFGDWRSQIGVVPLGAGEGGPVRQVTRGPHDHGEPSWSPDGRWFSFLANREEDADYHLNVRDVWVVPVSPDGAPAGVGTGGGAGGAGGEEAQLHGAAGLPPGAIRLTDHRYGVESHRWRPLGDAIACLFSDPDDDGYGNDWLSVLELEESGAGAASESARGAPGGLAVVRSRDLSRSLDRPIGDASIHDMPAPGGASFAWTPEGDAVLATVSDGGRVQLWRFDAASGEGAQITHGDWIVYDFAPGFSGNVAGGGDALVLAVNRPSDPSAIVRIRRGLPEERLAEPNAAFLSTRKVFLPERFTFRSPDGTEVDGWVMRGAGASESAPGPAILEIHGGPMGMYGDHFFLEFQVLAGAGFSVVYTNPRGSLGYGAAFCAAIKAAWGGRDYEDVMAGIEAACDRFPFIDAERLGVAGGSYGGWMVNWVVGHTDRFKAAVTMRSVVNRMSAIGTADFGLNRIRQYGPPPWEDPTPYLRQSPLPHVANIVTPLLIEHQENDYRCPMEQAEQLYGALKYLRREVKFVRYPDESHGMSRTGKPWHRVYRLKTNTAWFREHIPVGEPAGTS